MSVDTMGMRTTYSGAAARMRQGDAAMVPDADMLRLMQQIGELAVKRAKKPTGKNWTDRTGNLRSSIGYVILHDGDIADVSTFGQVADGSEGAAEGRGYAERLAGELAKPDCWQIILVAGMDYAVHLYNKGYDVCVSAETEVERLMANLKRNLGNRR